jgi:hypothetical protein
VPTHAGPYRIRQKLAEGAITTFYRAEHEKLGRIVLLKTLKDSLVKGSPLAAALDREAKILSKLGHPAIVRLLDVSADSEATWMALENVEGPSLATVLEKAGTLEPASAAAITLEIALGLGHTHLRRFVHRNVEPEGIVVSPDGRVVLVDFSAAGDFDGKVWPSNFEVSESIHGPRHAAPEIIMGEPATAQSDVFSLGVVFYEMLCGTGPWDAGNPTVLDLARRIRSDEPTPLSKHGIQAPESLLRIVMRCLAKRPEERYEDGAAVASALEEALDGLSTLSAPVLVTRALARAGLGEVLVEDKVRRKPKKATSTLPLRMLGWQLLALFGLVVTGAVVIEGFIRETGVVLLSEENVSGADRGYLRVLARPWAEVVVDGKTVEVTPIARAIAVTAGTHYVTLKHPNAPDEKREIRVTPGQTVLVDVTMQIERRPAGSNVDGGVEVDAAPSP